MKSIYRPDYAPHQASYLRAQRRRHLLRVAKAAGLFLAAAGSIALLAAAWSAFGPGWVGARIASLGMLRLEKVEVSGNRALPVHAVLETAGLRTGIGLLGLDLDLARARLLAHPLVREASLRRRLPSTLIVEIAERAPSVVVRADRDYLLDQTGFVMRGLTPADAASLPVLTGVEIPGGVLTARGAEDVAAGIELIAAIRETGFPTMEAISHIDLSDPEDAVIVPLSGRPLVHAGRGEPALRLKRWKSVAADMAGRWPDLEYVDLRPDGQVVAMPAAPAPAPAKAGGADAGPGAKGGPGAGREPGHDAAGRHDA